MSSVTVVNECGEIVAHVSMGDGGNLRGIMVEGYRAYADGDEVDIDKELEDINEEFEKAIGDLIKGSKKPLIMSDREYVNINRE